MYFVLNISIAFGDTTMRCFRTMFLHIEKSATYGTVITIDHRIWFQRLFFSVIFTVYVKSLI